MKKRIPVLLFTVLVCSLLCVTALADENKLSLKVNFEENWFFSRYDVTVLVDAQEIGTYSHGVDFTAEADIADGQHTITFQKVDDESVNGTVEFTSAGGAEVSCRISCFSTEVYVTKVKTAPNLTVPQPEITATPKATATPKPTEAIPVLGSKEMPMTIDNCEEFSAFMQVKSLYGDGGKTVNAFVSEHKGQIISFDGYVADIAKHGSYKTRYDVLLCKGDAYDASSDLSFQFVDMNFSDMHVENAETVRVGMNFTITAEIVSYSSTTGLIRLEPVSMVYRK